MINRRCYTPYATGYGHNTHNDCISKGANINLGRWTSEEKTTFIRAILIHGSQWDKVQECIKTRNKKQIISHNQKLTKKIKAKLSEEGNIADSIFLRIIDTFAENFNSELKSSIKFLKKIGFSNPFQKLAGNLESIFFPSKNELNKFDIESKKNL
jgi:hypothetical protein